MKKLRLGLVLALIGVTLFSCSNDDGYSLGDFWVTTGTVVKTSDYFYVVTDGGDDLWPAATNVSPESLEDGMRIMLNYTILGDDPDGSYDYYVKINGYWELLTKPVFNFDENTLESVKDSIGNDAVSITDTWFTNDYLNVQFEYGGAPGYVHFINMVKDTEDLLTENGEVILELKHNKNGDPYNNLQWGIASIDISELKEEGKESVQLILRSINTAGELIYTEPLTYRYDQPGVEPVVKAFSTTPMADLIE
ncbi:MULTISPECIES: NigD-like protein [unclassified Carboxylicivirga]|uniref:NigD-like protein n=1 Tax=Carboxylicivirga TaxID=1628153 RepID=UPI003D347241